MATTKKRAKSNAALKAEIARLTEALRVCRGELAETNEALRHHVTSRNQLLHDNQRAKERIADLQCTVSRLETLEHKHLTEIKVLQDQHTQSVKGFAAMDAEQVQLRYELKRKDKELAVAHERIRELQLQLHSTAVAAGHLADAIENQPTFK